MSLRAASAVSGRPEVDLKHPCNRIVYIVLMHPQGRTMCQLDNHPASKI